MWVCTLRQTLYKISGKVWCVSLVRIECPLRWVFITFFSLLKLPLLNAPIIDATTDMLMWNKLSMSLVVWQMTMLYFINIHASPCAHILILFMASTIQYQSLLFKNFQVNITLHITELSQLDYNPIDNGL